MTSGGIKSAWASLAVISVLKEESLLLDMLFLSSEVSLLKLNPFESSAATLCIPFDISWTKSLISVLSGRSINSWLVCAFISSLCPSCEWDDVLLLVLLWTELLSAAICGGCGSQSSLFSMFDDVIETSALWVVSSFASLFGSSSCSVGVSISNKNYSYIKL